MTDLQPCPFCGGKVTTRMNSVMGNLMTYILCGSKDDGSDGCGAITSFRPHKYGEQAARAFNRRAAQAQAKGE